MPNDNTAVCGCGVVLDLPKSRNGMTAISMRNFTILIPKSGRTTAASAGGQSKIEGRPAAKKPSEIEQQQQQQQQTISRSRGHADTGSPSSVVEQASGRPGKSNNKKDKRINSSRRTRSAERAESHYTYIDSGSSIVGSGIRENTIAEALYCTIDDDDLSQHQQQQSSAAAATAATGNGGGGNGSSQQQQQSAGTQQNNRPQQPVYAVPSMTSPPPTYDVAIAKSWQTGMPPSYEEYLCHKPALLSRSHTPPPPWTDSPTNSSASSGMTCVGGAAGCNGVDLQQISRELLASQPELRDYLTQLALQDGAEQAAQRYHELLSQQVLRKQAARAQRTRAMPPRSQSESRAQQQRIATMYEDGAFCMETAVIQSAIENGGAFCSLM